jgi:hypothetical protein
MVVGIYGPRYWESQVGGSWPKASARQNHKTLSEKYFKAKWARGMALGEEHLPNKPKALSSSTSVSPPHPPRKVNTNL